MKKFLTNNGPNAVPSGPLILIADALWFWFEKKRWTMYLMADRKISSDRAVILDPVLLLGRENYDDWSKVINDLPLKTRSRIKALVCNGFRGELPVIMAG